MSALRHTIPFPLNIHHRQVYSGKLIACNRIRNDVSIWWSHSEHAYSGLDDAVVGWHPHHNTRIFNSFIILFRSVRVIHFVSRSMHCTVYNKDILRVLFSAPPSNAVCWHTSMHVLCVQHACMLGDDFCVLQNRLCVSRKS